MVSYSINADENCTSFQVVNTSCYAEVQPAAKSVRESGLRIATPEVHVINSRSLQLGSLLQLDRILVLIAVAARFGVRLRQCPELALA